MILSRNRYIEGLNYELPHPFRRDADSLAEKFETNTYKDENYVLRWKTNKQVPPQDVLDFWKHIGKRFNMSKSVNAREKEDRIFIENYKKQQSQRKPSAEEMYEMQAAFGKGATVVDVITGQKIKL